MLNLYNFTKNLTLTEFQKNLCSRPGQFFQNLSKRKRMDLQGKARPSKADLFPNRNNADVTEIRIELMFAADEIHVQQVRKNSTGK